MGDATGYEERLQAVAQERRRQLMVSHAEIDTIHSAAEAGDIAKLISFIEEGDAKGYPESVTMQTREAVLGLMPLHIAAEHGRLEVVEFLISKRVDVDAGDNAGVKALHLAAINNHIEVAKALFAAGANPDLEDKSGDTPLHWAATKGHEGMLELLILKQANVNHLNRIGWTPLLRAAYNGREQAIKVLVKHGASLVSRTSKEGNTPLHLACLMNHIASIQMILSLGSPMELVNKNGKTCYEVCFTDGGREVCESFGYSFVTREDLGAKKEKEEREAASRNQAGQIEVKLKKLEMMRSANSLTRREHTRPIDDFPEDDFLTATKVPSKRIAHAYDDEDDNADVASALLKPSAFLKEVAQEGREANPYAAPTGLPGPSQHRLGSGRSTLGGLGGQLGRGGGGGMVEGCVGVTSALSFESSGAQLQSVDGLPPRPGSRNLSSRPLMGGPMPLPPIFGSLSFTQVTNGILLTSSSGSSFSNSRGGSRGETGFGPLFQAGVGPASERMERAQEGQAVVRRDRNEGTRLVRPQSGNKKFLAKYKLDKFQLFTPS